MRKNNCFVCGMDNPEGMRLKFVLDEERQTFVCRFRLSKRYTGPPGHCHGGVIACILDDAMGKVNKLHHVVALTREMTVEYLRPVPLPDFSGSRDAKSKFAAKPTSTPPKSSTTKTKCWPAVAASLSPSIQKKCSRNTYKNERLLRGESRLAGCLFAREHFSNSCIEARFVEMRRTSTNLHQIPLFFTDKY